MVGERIRRMVAGDEKRLREGNHLMDRDARDIARTLQRRAHQSTVDFVVANLQDVKAFRDRLSMLSYCLTLAPKEGDILEFGVFRGKSLNLLAREAGPQRRLYGFDSFEGLPEEWKGGGVPKGFFAVKKIPKVPPNVTLVKGWFDATVPPFVQAHRGRPALVHVDSDLYSSGKLVLDHVGPLCGPGTVLVFDEFFNYPGWEDGEARAFRETKAALGWKTSYVAYCSAAEQVAVRLEP